MWQASEFEQALDIFQDMRNQCTTGRDISHHIKDHWDAFKKHGESFIRHIEQTDLHEVNVCLWRNERLKHTPTWTQDGVLREREQDDSVNPIVWRGVIQFKVGRNLRRHRHKIFEGTGLNVDGIIGKSGNYTGNITLNINEWPHLKSIVAMKRLNDVLFAQTSDLYHTYQRK